jgi:hypothetical protein
MTTDPTLHTVAAWFASDVAEHKMTVLHDDGLYRHLRFKQPHSSICYFDLITWPGRLVICGDMNDAYVFTRYDQDMFTLFRPTRYESGINPGYWAQKLADHGHSVRVYSEDVLRERVKEAIAEYEEDWPERQAEHASKLATYEATEPDRRWPMDRTGPRHPGTLVSPDEARETVADADASGDLDYEDGARRLLRELQDAGVGYDSWDCDLTSWDFHFLRACHAIVWGITQYDTAISNGWHVPTTGRVMAAVPLPTTPPARPRPVQTEAASEAIL